MVDPKLDGPPSREEAELYLYRMVAKHENYYVPVIAIGAPIRYRRMSSAADVYNLCHKETEILDAFRFAVHEFIRRELDR